MARPEKRLPTERIVVTATPKLVAYIDDVILAEGYGTSRAEVARTLVWRGIEELMSRNIISRRGNDET